MPQLTCSNNHSFTLPNGTRVLPWCPNCEKAHAEKAIIKALTLMGQTPSKRYVIPSIPTLTYSCYLWYNNQKVVIEFDGHDLFEYTEWCTESLEVWNNRRLVERVKTYVAMDENHKVIRVSYDYLHRDLMDYLQKSLNDPVNYVVTNPDLYQWNTKPSNPEIAIYRVNVPSSTRPKPPQITHSKQNKRKRNTDEPEKPSARESVARTRNGSSRVSTRATKPRLEASTSPNLASSASTGGAEQPVSGLDFTLSGLGAIFQPLTRMVPRLVVHDYAQAIRNGSAQRGARVIQLKISKPKA